MLKKEEILKNVPDFYDGEEAVKWIQKGKELVEQLTPEKIKDTPISFVEWSGGRDEHLLGLYASEMWRKHVLSIFLADLISYVNPSDQVNFDRLLYVMHAFPEGFRTWWIEIEGQWWPGGYTGWYPMLETTFDLFEKQPDKLKDRMVVPNPSSRYLYLFNYSVASNLKKTPLSRALIKRFIEDIEHQKAKGLACITVSHDGVRIGESLGMVRSGEINGEGVYTKRF